MLIEQGDSLERVFSNLKHEIHRATQDKRHPFRFCLFSTFGEIYPESRFVVLRKVDDELNCFIHTDDRSDKIHEIKNDEHVSIVFYHQKKKVQIRFKGKAELKESKDDIWDPIPSIGKKSYTSIKGPGEEISEPEEAWSWDEEEKDDHFHIIKVIPEEIDILQLSGFSHLRAVYSQDNNDWKGHWVVP